MEQKNRELFPFYGHGADVASLWFPLQTNLISFHIRHNNALNSPLKKLIARVLYWRTDACVFWLSFYWC